MRADDCRQLVEGNFARQVMNMVYADIAGEPHQRLGQVVVRAPMQRCMLVSPPGLHVPVGFVKLMLNVEKPHTD